MANNLKVFLIVSAAAVYFLSPIDAIPDLIPLLGWLDDIGLITWAVKTIRALNAKGTEGHAEAELVAPQTDPPR